MRIEEVVGRRVSEYRTAVELSQAELGERLSVLLGKSWPRQSVWAAEKGQRAFTAAELLALVEVLRLPGVDELFVPPWDVDTIELGGQAIEHLGLPRAGGGSRSDSLRDTLHLIKEQVQELVELQKLEESRVRDLTDHRSQAVAALRDAVGIAMRLNSPDDQSEDPS